MATQHRQQMVAVEISPESAYDRIGSPAILTRGEVCEFTPTEAKELLALRDEHGRALVRKADNGSNGGQ